MIVIVIGTVLGSQSINSVYSYNDYTTLNLQPDIKNHKNSFFNSLRYVSIWILFCGRITLGIDKNTSS